MNLITATDIRSLAEEQGGPRVSIFLPTHLGTNAIQQDPIRLKNLLKTAHRRLVDEKGMRSPDAAELLEPGWDLIEHGEIWREQGRGGVAVFLGGGVSESFRVPLHLDEQVVVNDRFFVRPLLPILHAEERFFVLTLEQRGGVHLLECTPTGVREIDLPKGTPRTLEEAVRVEDRGTSLQWRRTGGQVKGAGRDATRDSTFHSNAVDNQTADAEQRDFLHQLQKGVFDKLKLESAPLVLAGTEFMQSLYREANRYPHLYDEGINGTPKVLNHTELRDRALELLKPYFDRARDAAADRFREYYGTGRASTDPFSIVPAAAFGRVESLLVADAARHQWGRFDDRTGEVVVHERPVPGDEDLADLAVAKTLLNGGEVFRAPAGTVPQGASMAAVFRY